MGGVEDLAQLRGKNSKRQVSANDYMEETEHPHPTDLPNPNMPKPQTLAVLETSLLQNSSPLVS